MLFNSYEFMFVFLPVVISGYFCFGKLFSMKYANLWLVIGSLFFYSYWNIIYLPLLLSSILFNYFIGQAIEKKENKRAYLLFGIVVNLLLLAYFKYLAFCISSINYFFDFQIVVPSILLPLGISFFTFTQTAYLVDAYRGETKGYSLTTYSLFVTIFPHLIAGPIIHHKNMIAQFSKLENLHVNYDNLSKGLAFFFIGLFKKVVIADTLSPWVALAFDHAADLSFFEAWIGAIAYSLQLYFDFSGYSEMAIGLGLLLNLNFPVNFNSPYKAISIIDFWRRWHMTLSAFLKNYLYIPLGGNRHGEYMKMRNLLITMFLGGLWHGAGWTFVVWGTLHGFYLVINHQWNKIGKPLPKVIAWGITFSAVVIAWVFFRAHNIQDALLIIKAMANLSDIRTSDLVYSNGKPEYCFVFVILCITLCLNNTQERLSNFVINRKILAVITGLAIISMYYLSQVSDFLYFQF